MPTATSLSLETGPADPPERTDVLLDVVAAIREAYDAWQVGGEPAGQRLAASYAAACVTVGRQVRVDLPDGSVLDGPGRRRRRDGAARRRGLGRTPRGRRRRRGPRACARD